MSRVLLVDDSTDCQILVSRALQDAVVLKIASDLAQARQLITADPFDLLLLDVNLPDGNGFGLCSSLLAENPARRPRVIFLTGSQGVDEKVTGFSVGADDYVTKPFDPLELKARVLAHLRRLSELTHSAQLTRVGDLTLDSSCFRAELDTKNVDLTPIEFRLLHALARNEGRILSRERLLEAHSGQAEEGILDRTIDAHLCKIRKKLGSFSHEIESVYGIGYRLVKVREKS